MNLKFLLSKQVLHRLKVKRSIVLDKKEVILKILSSYEEITVMDQQDEDGIVFFKIKVIHC